ncbi:MAG: hypothetical protein GX608_03835, partial [Lentisphaerae bacterium]|nr:hypothetical protein [Lentisphaerota bacterium]
MTRTALLAATIAMGWALAAGAQTIRYVAQGGQTPAAPYLNWATAASNIQDAVDAAEDGDTVLVSNGLYNTGGQRLPDEGFLTNRVFVANAVTVRSVNGPAATTIRGNATEGGNAVRCVLLQSGAVLDGFALAGGGVISDVMSLYDGFGGGVLLKEGGIISNCWISGCKGSGVYMFRGGRMADCLVQSNTSLSGGGVICEPSDFAENEIERCRILDNTAEASGGGIFSMGNLKIHDSLICGNLAADASVGIGGGIWMSGGTIANCTIAWNESRCKGGGIGDLSNPEYGQQLCEIVNTILYHNTAPIGSNFHVLGTSITYSCTYPLPEGDGNTAEAPLLLGFRNPHIAAASPCRGAGTTSCLYAGETDIDGEPRAWGGSADIGCDQFVYTNIAGTLNMVIDAPFTNALVNEPLRFRSALEGKADVFTWTVATPTGAMLRANEADWTYAWNMTGVYAVALSATNSACAAAVTATVTIVDHFTNYFDPAGSHVPPFTNWSQAATNLQDAIDACRIGGMVMVQTGVHACADEVLLNRGVTVRGAGTAADTAFVGGGSNRCFSLADPDAALERITISNGKAATGAGVYLSGGTVRQCMLSGNSATIKGGGAYMERGGLLEDCRISGNYALKWGGGAFVQGDARISRCLVISNATDYYGGGLYAYLGAQADNCYFAGNSSWGGGGMILFIGCAARNCTLARNMAEGDGGGIFFLDSTAINCLVYFNEAADYSSDNYFFDVTDQSSVISHCCADPLPAGDGNMAVNPLLAGIENPHLLAASPCRAAGDASAVAPGATDIDGEPRAHGGAADIGCDEYIPGAVTGALAVAISGDTNTIYGVAELLGADISGKATGLAWRVGRGAGQYDCMTNLFEIAPVWTNAGYFEVVLSAGNESGGSSATVTVHVAAGGYTNYVSTSGAHVPPFTNWATASTSIQAAVDSCYEGGVVLVQTGRYEISSALLLAKPVSVQSVGGPELTTIDAGRRCRGVMIPADGVLLAGFTITNGYAAGAAGGFMLGGTVSNCVISGCA